MSKAERLAKKWTKRNAQQAARALSRSTGMSVRSARLRLAIAEVTLRRSFRPFWETLLPRPMESTT
jgi:hypothetical protein